VRYINALPITPISQLSAFQRALGWFVAIAHSDISCSGSWDLKKAYTDLYQDTVVEAFWNVYPYEAPQSIEKLGPARRMIKMAMEELQKSKEFEDIKKLCRGDIINSAVMAEEIAYQIFQRLDSNNSLSKELENEMQGKEGEPSEADKSKAQRAGQSTGQR
jgi:hypothetical protein